jgi:hypothetical protein
MFVAYCVVKATAVDFHRIGQVTERSAIVALLPKNLHGPLNSFSLIKLNISWHALINLSANIQ